MAITTYEQNYLTATVVNTFIDHFNATGNQNCAAEVYQDIQANSAQDPRVVEGIKHTNFSQEYVQSIIDSNRRLTPYTLQDVADADAAGTDIRRISCSNDNVLNPGANHQ